MRRYGVFRQSTTSPPGEPAVGSDMRAMRAPISGCPPAGASSARMRFNAGASEPRPVFLVQCRTVLPATAAAVLLRRTRRSCQGAASSPPAPSDVIRPALFIRRRRSVSPCCTAPRPRSPGPRTHARPTRRAQFRHAAPRAFRRSSVSPLVVPRRSYGACHASQLARPRRWFGGGFAPPGVSIPYRCWRAELPSWTLTGGCPRPCVRAPWRDPLLVSPRCDPPLARGAPSSVSALRTSAHAVAPQLQARAKHACKRCTCTHAGCRHPVVRMRILCAQAASKAEQRRVRCVQSRAMRVGAGDARKCG
eukprot:6207558-Pleurochrysis_carterae.AAC.4